MRLTPVNTYAYVCTLLFPFIFTWLFTIVNSTYISPWIRSENFDSDKWKQEESFRYRMVKDIIESKLLNGMTKEEVITLLGNDMENGPCDNCIGYSTNEPDGGFSLDHEVLEVHFDRQNMVTLVSIDHW